jgi:hypothetical protein
MPLFGQVWLWSSLAFLAGALLCWLLVARPARNRVGELEAQLTTRARRFAAPPERPEQKRRDDDRGGVVPGFDPDDDADFRTRAYGGLRDTPPPLPPERDRDRLAQYAEPDPSDRGFAPLPPEQPAFEPGFDRAPAEPEPDFAEPSRPAAATQYLDVSAGTLSAPPEVPAMSPPPSDRGWFDDELEGDEANQAPEEQAAVPRNRHHLNEDEDPFADGHLVDDEDESDIAAALGSAPDEPRSAIEDEDGGTVFTQRTHPIPGELIRQIDEAGKEELARAEPDQFVDDMADTGDEIARRDRTVESEAVAPPAAFTEPESSGSRFTEPESSGSRFSEPEPSGSRFTEPSNGQFTEPSDGRFPEPSGGRFAEPEPSGSRFSEPERSSGGFTEPAFTEPEPAAAAFTEPESMPSAPPEAPAEQTEVVAVVPPVEEETPVEPTRTGNNLPKRVPQKNRISQGAVSVRVDPTPSALPKRVPGKPRHQIPFGVEPSATPEPVSAATEDQPAEAQRSLFEPIVPAADEGNATPPPPHRLRQESGGGRGPFGPGSAMPLPGGASPSPDFTIKASVAALRYCTPESPQFGRTVAEVWFRTAADAERVGFRPVG